MSSQPPQRPYYSRTSSRMSQYELSNYARSRQAAYPGTYRQEHPTQEVKDDYERYKCRQEESDRSIEEYHGTLSSITNEDDGDIEGLNQREHFMMLSPSAEAAMNSAS